jgi:hypothetical protein
VLSGLLGVFWVVFSCLLSNYVVLHQILFTFESGMENRLNIIRLAIKNKISRPYPLPIFSLMPILTKNPDSNGKFKN